MHPIDKTSPPAPVAKPPTLRLNSLATRRRKTPPKLPIRICVPKAQPSVAKQPPRWLRRVIAIVGQACLAIRRLSRPGASVLPTPAPSSLALEKKIALALASQGRADGETVACKAYQAARSAHGASKDAYKNLINDMWVDPTTGLKASCLTHALWSGKQEVAHCLVAHGAEESYVYFASGSDIERANKAVKKSHRSSLPAIRSLPEKVLE